MDQVIKTAEELEMPSATGVQSGSVPSEAQIDEFITQSFDNIKPVSEQIAYSSSMDEMFHSNPTPSLENEVFMEGELTTCRIVPDLDAYE